MKKKMFALLMAATMVASMAGCGSQKEETAAPAEDTETAEEAEDPASPEGEEVYVIMVNALNGHPVYEQQAEGARKAAEDYGVNLEIIGTAMGSATMTQDTIQAMENAVTMAPDAIICEPCDPAYFANVTKMYEAGIPVICTSNPVDNEEEYVSCIGTDNEQYGRTAIDMIAEETNGEAHILAVLGNLNTVNQAQQLQGMRDQIEEKYPNMEIVDAVADDNDLSKAVQLFQDNFNSYPEIDTVVMLEATGGPGAAQVAKEMNREIRILDIDAIPETINNLKEGKEWATLAQNFYKRGYESVRMAYEYVTQDGEVDFPKFIDSGTVLITQDSAATYEEDLWSAVKVKGTEW